MAPTRFPDIPSGKLRNKKSKIQIMIFINFFLDTHIQHMFQLHQDHVGHIPGPQRRAIHTKNIMKQLLNLYINKMKLTVIIDLRLMD